MEQALGSGAVEIEAVAATFGLHPRTLQRRLESEGASYADILDTARRETALRYLVGTALPLTRVTAAIGLAEQSALTRCCLRWFGATPSAVRRNGRAADLVASG